jgi:hypothetical protein
MSVVAWFLSEAAFPVSLAAGFGLAVDIARHGPVRVRHYRWRNRRFLKKLRSDRRGRSGEADRSHPQGRSAVAGVERGRVPHVAAAAPPVPYPLAGAVYPAPAPARPPRVAVHG